MSARVAIVCLLALMAAGCDRQSAAPGQANTADTNTASPDEATAPAATTAQVGVDRSHAGEAAPSTPFKGPDGKPTTLAAFKGKPVLVNLWATWCAPCVVEMPALDNLAGAMEGRVKVLTISQDRRTELVPEFFAARDFRHLEQWLDPENELALAFTDGGLLPVTILFDAQGREILRVAGGYEWDSEEAIALVSEALSEADSAS